MNPQASVPAQLLDCKSCEGTVRLSEQEMRLIFGDALKVRDVKLATEETYNSRLAVCADCDSLQAGTTCEHCGCVVQVKAKLLHAKCPYPFMPKW
jgi:hypothetical protein